LMSDIFWAYFMANTILTPVAPVSICPYMSQSSGFMVI
jgi:hypothetical protein